MVDQLTSAGTCRSCGAPLSQDVFSTDGLCGACAYVASAPVVATPEQQPIDPDHPGWGPPTGIGIWIVSVAAIIVVPVIAVFVWYFVQSGRGAPVPSLTARDELLEWLKSPTLLLVQVLSTIVAHAVTVLICWAVVTRFGKRPFWKTLGWGWAGHSLWYWVIFSGCVLLAVMGATQLLSRFLPQSEQNSFAELLRSSQQVRIAIALLATFTAPIVEETVYRGILFSGLRRYLGLAATVIVVAIMFTGVHVLQYWGAWVSIAGLSMLSLALTIVRARTKSILPCVLIHTLNNAFFSVLILLNKAS